MTPAATLRHAAVILGPMLMAHAPAAHATQDLPRADTLRLRGLAAPVTIVRDEWGVAHIYAENEADLFFAQGYSAARDRLFQFEIWRRQATGTVAEILGPRALERDIGARLFMFRGDMEQELKHYHPRGDEIITAFVDGVNAYIEETRQDPELLPIEFELLGIQPGTWTPEVVVSRHQGLVGNVRAELDYGRAVALLGPDQVEAVEVFGPGEPELALDDAIDGSLLSADILRLYNAYRGGLRFRPEDVVAAYRGDEDAYRRLARAAELAAQQNSRDRESIGSNNWVVSGALTESGHPIMANDPHRAQSAPSLRYLVHLVAPGWNVIGAGEPEIPGVSIGHNEYGAWGLTVFNTDSEDLYVYETNPEDPSQYRYRGGWEAMRIIEETIPVKGRAPVTVELKYTRHGPVVYEDEEHHRAYAVRAAWLEVGGAPYLASLRMDQARSWEEFREACSYSHLPGENMVWADRDGNIGWQAVGIAPIRPAPGGSRRSNWSGLVPVPGDGRYEWAGYLPIKALPHVYNPEQGFWATANNNLIPRDYPYREAVGWTWTAPYRWARINEVLASGRRHGMMDMMQLQTDELSIPARTLVPLLEGLSAESERAEWARELLLDWDYVLDKSSVAAAVFVAWRRRLEENTSQLFVPAEARRLLGGLPMERMIGALLAPDGRFGDDPIEGRDRVLLTSLEEAVRALEDRLGPDPSRWQYGQTAYKHALIRHPLSAAVAEEIRSRLDVGPAPRGGGSYTVNNTGGGDNQTSGASFRIIVDTGDWDKTVATNNPGQSGDPESPYYDNLFGLWAQNRYFPLFYSREKVESVADQRFVLLPRGGVATDSPS